jgi:hypothetical protein
MPATGSNISEGRKTAKLVGLLDSPQDAEAAGALHRIRVRLKKQGLTFYQAVEDHEYKIGIWEAFGQPECLREYFERKQNSGNETQLREEIGRLQTALGERERGGARLAEALDAMQQKFDEYRRKAEEHLQTPPPSGGLVNGGSVFIVTMLAMGLAVASAFYHDARELVTRVSVEVKKETAKTGKRRLEKKSTAPREKKRSAPAHR